MQLDNASTHVGLGTLEKLNSYCRKNGYNISYETQPSNSPDLNICDLSFFNSLKKRADILKRNSKNIEDLIGAVQLSFSQYDQETLKISYGHLYACFKEILKSKGDNQLNWQMEYH